ncbi:MAG TPA: efflux RND transporter periplasmic adaptor subunit [Myxococcota bacterium]|nr:efflux RND transporter periplasmic adaptor subunit [Myxococcota bacterium]
MIPIRRHPASTFLSLLVFVAFLPSCGKKTEVSGSDGKEAAKTVMVQTLARTDIVDKLSYVADLKPHTEIKIFSQVPDRILYFPFNDGDLIQRGQRLALIRREGMEKGLEQMAAQGEALAIQIRNLERELKRSAELLRSGVITQPVFDKLKTTYDASVAQRKALDAGRSQLAVRAGNAAINAPISGVIAGKMLEKGDMAVPQVPLCRILDIERLKIEIKLVEKDVARVRLGQEVRIKLDCCGDKIFIGKLTSIRPYIDPDTRTNTVEVTLDNPRDKITGLWLLKPGMFGRAELIVSERKDVLAAPEPALLLDNRLLKQQQAGEILRKAFVVDDQGLAHQRLVRLGARKGSLYEVLAGLQEGDRVVVRGQHGLRDGQQVEIVTDK